LDLDILCRKCPTKFGYGRAWYCIVQGPFGVYIFFSRRFASVSLATDFFILFHKSSRSRIAHNHKVLMRSFSSQLLLWCCFYILHYQIFMTNHNTHESSIIYLRILFFRKNVKDLRFIIEEVEFRLHSS
jgi:hypothetical protein